MYSGIDAFQEAYLQQLEIETQNFTNNDPTFSWDGFDPPLVFSVDPQTGRTVVTFRDGLGGLSAPTCSFNVEDSIGPFLGFDDQTTLIANASLNTPLVYLAPNAAKVNSVNSYFIHTDLVQIGMSINGSAKQVVSQVPILVDTLGKQIKYSPPVPTICQAPFLAGNTKNSVLCWLTDEKNQPVDTQGEYWDFRLRISYWYDPQKPNVTTL